MQTRAEDQGEGTPRAESGRHGGEASQPARYADGDGRQCGGGDQDQYGEGDCNRQVTSISIHMAKPGLATAPRGLCRAKTGVSR